MSKPHTVYTTTYQPDVTNANHVLAFMLVPEALFYSPEDDAATRRATGTLLYEAKRTTLLTWYAHAMKERP